MQTLTTHYFVRAEIWLFITTLAYFLMNGAQLFETAVIVPKWTAAPPESFQLFKGKHGLDFKVFWIVAHSIHELTFILAIVFCWKIDPVRNWLLILFAFHFAVRVWTLKIANGTAEGTNLAARAALWKTLNYVRVGIFVAVSLGLVPLCIRLLNLRGNN